MKVIWLSHAVLMSAGEDDDFEMERGFTVVLNSFEALFERALVS